MTRDLRVCFLGDSFVAGVGDQHYQGWVGRIAQHTHAAGLALTAYNLGIRGQTSVEVAARWQLEAAPRLSARCDNRLVVSFGVNDTASDGPPRRVGFQDSGRSLQALLNGAARLQLPVLVVGPPPVADTAHTARTAELDQLFLTVCRAHGTPYIPVLQALQNTSFWSTDLLDDDGAHPGAAGYQELADLIFPTWWR